MKAAVFNPYLDTLGGGERYTMAFAKVLADKMYEVDVQWDEVSIKEKLENRFGLDLKKINIVKTIAKGDGYEICFWLSDGSIPLLRARKNFLHFQFPFTNVNGGSLFNKMKLYRVDEIICNSYFTKRFIDEEYKVNSIVIYPPVDVSSFKPKNKENIILYVGRFSQLTQAKNQHILVELFKKMNKKFPEWKLVLAGGSDVGVDNYVKKLKKAAKGFSIEIIENPDFERLKDLYGKSKIFWSAAGYGLNENKEPKKVEHFGISIVEAMASGVVPLVFNAGGPKEIIASGENGYLWKKEDQVINYTSELIKNDALLKSISKKSIEDSKIYKYERFKAQVKEIL